MSKDSIVLIATKNKLKGVFKKIFVDFYGNYKNSKDADELYKDIDSNINLLENEMIAFIESDDISLDSCLEMMSATFIIALLVTLESDRESISPNG